MIPKLSNLWGGSAGRAEKSRASLLRLESRWQHHLGVILMVAEACCVLLAAATATHLRFGEVLPPSPLTAVAVVMPLVAVFAMAAVGVYDQLVADTLRVAFARTALAFAVCFGGLIVAAYMLKIGQQISRLWIGYFAVIAFGSVLSLRFCVLYALKYFGLAKQLDTALCIIHDGSEPDLVREINERVAMRGAAYVTGEIELPRKADRGDADRTLQLMQRHPPDVVIAILADGAEDAGGAALAKLAALSVPILYFQKDVGRTVRQHRFPDWQWTTFAGLPFMAEAGTRFSYRVYLTKLVEDYVLATLLLVALSPLMAAIALLIKLEGEGPVLFRQPRHGFNGRRFDVWKFRTMRGHVEDDGIAQATRGDPRVTRLGRFLRRTSLDELPQLFNVLRGEMSLVGPRPHALPHDEKFSAVVANYFARHRVKPGITGLAQINGYRGEITSNALIEKRVEHDIFYIRNWSLALDLRILVATLFVVFCHPNAY